MKPSLFRIKTDQIINRSHVQKGCNPQNQLLILMYHAVVHSLLKVTDWCFIDESSFVHQINYLKKNFDIVTLSEAIDRLANGKIYHPTAVITFDDGFQNNYRVAFPILCEEKLPATIFLVTGLINTDDTLWYCRLNRAIAKTNKDSIKWNNNIYDLSANKQKVRASSEIQDKLKKFPHTKLPLELQKIIIELGDDPDLSIEDGSPYRILNQKEITEMANSGLIEFGAHTHSHAILSLLSPKKQHQEIEGSVNIIKDLTRESCKYFAYPNGQSQDYNEDTIEVLKACGIRAALTTIEGPNELTSLMQLRRFGIGANLSFNQFKQIVSVKI
jgi:peptidoglycan/xylan/chitin deacetylase (PgdA/CDA1 family)